MWNVIIALIPAAVVAVLVFGLQALLVMAISVSGCVVTEWLIDKYMLHRTPHIGNGSAIITGLLLAFNVPSILPWWIVIIGAVVAIGIGKMSFGGLGCNIWNPALVGRVFLLISFPAAMTTWPAAVPSGIDAVSGATILSTMKAYHHTLFIGQTDVWQMLSGQINGSLGEVSAIAILIGLVYLLATRTITWHIPAAVLGSAAIFSWIAGVSVGIELLSGGMLLGAVFMATDYVTSPMTHKGQLIFGVGIGVITMIIRLWGSYPEGMSFAILLMNSFVPLINRYCKPRRFGERRKSAA